MEPKSILITGATAGIGRELALQLARDGHHVFATGRREEALATLREAARGTRLEAFSLDVTDAASIAEAARRVDHATGGHGLDVLVNNAGYGLFGPLETIGDRELRAQYDTNVFGLMAVTRAFLPRMRARGAGRIVNVSSVVGRITFPFMGAYNSTKYAVESLSDALRNELAAFGIDVVLIEPGVVRTEFTDRAMATVAVNPGSPYAAMLEAQERVRRRFEATGVPPEVIVRGIERAITTRRPRARYVLPARNLLAVALFALLPTRATDLMLRAMAGLSKPRATAPRLVAGS